MLADAFFHRSSFLSLPYGSPVYPRTSQPQPLVPERKRRRHEPHERGHEGEDGAAPSPPLLSFATAEALYEQAREVGGFVTTGSARSAKNEMLLLPELRFVKKGQQHVAGARGRQSVPNERGVY